MQYEQMKLKKKENNFHIERLTIERLMICMKLESESMKLNSVGFDITRTSRGKIDFLLVL